MIGIEYQMSQSEEEPLDSIILRLNGRRRKRTRPVSQVFGTYSNST